MRTPTQSIRNLPSIKLMGLTVRTNNASEMDPKTAKIAPTVTTYFSEKWAERIPHRVAPFTTYSAYTQYESDMMGDYTYFIGEAVSSFDEVPEGFSTFEIPAQTYEVFTDGPGAMPNVCIQMWKHIWELSLGDLKNKRSYVADFEIYDERAQDPNNTSLDIYIGVKEQ